MLVYNPSSSSSLLASTAVARLINCPGEVKRNYLPISKNLS